MSQQTRQEKSYCRLCFGYCGMNVTIENDRVVGLIGDHDNPATQGYACTKGLEAHFGMYGKSRVLRPLKKVGDKQVEIPLEQALDEIAARMRKIIDEDGPQSLAFFRGTGTMGSAISVFCYPGLADSIGGQRYSTMTIDQSAKWVTIDRLGTWAAGPHTFMDSDVWMFAGSNPLVSVFSWRMPAQNPMKALKRAKAKGTKIIVVDPRECELAKFADIHLQIFPGEDAAVAAGLIHIILANGWEDKEFCAKHVDGLDRLREAVAPFTPDMVAKRTGISAADLLAAADLFARQSKRGAVDTGTGVDMARFPNLAEHLYETIGVICGRMIREGEALPNPGVILDKPIPRAETAGPARTFEKMPKSRVRGAVRLMGESATPTLAEDILTPGPGRIRSLFISGANPAGAIPSQEKVGAAFRALDLLVVVEPFLTETARMADYVLPPKILYEHADFTFGLEISNLTQPYMQYTPTLVPPPANSELTDEGYVAWALCKRLGVTLNFMGVDMDMSKTPSDDDFLRILARNSAIPYDELKQSALGGKIYDLPPKIVAPASETAGKFAVMPPDVFDEVRRFAATKSTAEMVMVSGQSDLGFRLIARRIRETTNTQGRDFPSARARVPYNPLSVNPADLTDLGLKDGDEVEVISAHDRIPAIVKSDETLKRRVVSMTHGFGGMPGEVIDYRKQGANVSRLISLDHDCEPLQAMPLMSGVPVRIERALLRNTR